MKWTTVRDFLKSNAIVRALALSILIHFVAFLVVEVGNKAGLWKASLLAKTPTPNIPNLNPPPSEQQVVLQFIEVEPNQQPEPKDPKFYSTANSQAANPDTKNETPTPKNDGSQDKVPRVRDIANATPPPPPKPDTLQPAFKPSKPATTPKPEEGVGDTKENTLTEQEKAQRDLKMDRPASPQTQPRPRTLAEARQQKGIIEGPKMKQDGGVKKYALEMSPSAKMTPFGSYDAAFIAAVQKRWFDILDARSYAADRSGKVVVEFRMYKDGRIMNLQVVENDVTDTLAWACQRAILDPAPYAPFPPDLKRLLGTDYREVRFTFYYN